MHDRNARLPRLWSTAVLVALGTASACFAQSAPQSPKAGKPGKPTTSKAQATAAPKADAPAPEAKPLPAAGDDVRAWYLRNELGGNLIPAIGLADRSGFVGTDLVTTSDASLSMDAGFAWTIAGGWRMADFLAFEVSSGLSYNRFSHVTGTVTVNGASGSGSIDVGGSLLQVPVLGGVRLELPVAGDLRVNLGASAGGVYLGADLDTTLSIGGFDVPLQGSDGAWAFAYSATAGIEWDLMAGFGIGVAYRFLGTTSATFGPADLFGSEGVYNQNVVATLTIRF